MTQPISTSELCVVPESRSKPISSRGGLRFLCRLGQGGMAEVHLANAAPPSAPPNLVVVKRMHQQYLDDPGAVRMFLDEARLALCLSHPNIVRTERLGTFEGRHGIVMEFLEGQPLHQVLKRAYESEASVSLDFVVQVAIAALDGLHYAHELKDVVGNPLRLIHRDVSPQNLFVSYDGAVKLLDFGIAKNSMQDGRTRTGLLKGKISYMAPEQARGEELDRRADLWSLGVVLWEAVTGTRLFKGSNEAATLHLTLTEEVLPPSQRRPDLPFELEAILLRALERDRERRYATAAEMRDELEAWLSSRELTQEASLSLVMRRLFAREMREQRQQVAGLLQAQPEPAPESGMTMIAPSLGTATLSGSLRGTQVSSVTDLMDELTRQRRVTTRLLGGLLALMACALLFGVYWTLVLRPEQAQRVAVATAAPAPPPHVTAATLSAPAPSTADATSTPPSRESQREASAKPAALPAWKSAAHVAKRVPTPVAAIDSSPATPPPTAQSDTGLLNLDTTPWSVVSVGGRLLGQTPIIGVSLPVGTHTLVLSNSEQGIKTTYQVTISAGKTTARRIGLD
jgi:eukaryotic-like serine/threonine-protein kinase